MPNTPVLHYSITPLLPEIKEARQEKGDTIIFGIRPCDGKSFQILDKVFGGRFSDVYYLRKREKTALIGLACEKSCVNCFCTSLDGGPANREGLDILLTVSGDDYFIDVLTDAHGFLNEAHPKLRPMESMTAGIYLAGCAQAPRDIPDTVAQASGAAMLVTNLFASEELDHEPLTVGADEQKCSACGLCINVCAYQARELNTEKGIAEVNEILCEGCGACAAACLSGAAQQKNFTDAQLLRMVEELLV